MKPAPACAVRRALAHFPGGHAGASLKRRSIRHSGPAGAPDFPGGHAGASLKRPQRRVGRAGGRDISPADTPGPH